MTTAAVVTNSTHGLMNQLRLREEKNVALAVVEMPAARFEQARGTDHVRLRLRRVALGDRSARRRTGSRRS